MIEDPHAEDPTREMSATELREALADAIQRLPDREKLVITLYYYEELTLREIGEVLGVTESRVSQLHTKAILRLKVRMQGQVEQAPVERLLGVTPCPWPSPARSTRSGAATARRRDQRACERLILAYAPLVKYVAGRLGGRLPAHVDSEDLVQWGLEGLLSAVTRFDPALGNKFETFAISHIRGKMIDELRRMDFAPRSLRARAREVERAMQELESKLGRPPNDDEVAAALGVPGGGLPHHASATSPAPTWRRWTSCGRAARARTPRCRCWTRSRIRTPRTRRARCGPGERKEALFESVQRLPEREKLVVTLYYFEELTLREIGEVLRVTESRVSQLHTKALLRLRGHLGSTI